MDICKKRNLLIVSLYHLQFYQIALGE